MYQSRPATVVTAVLAVLFLLACPQSIGAAVAVLAWLLTDPTGSVLLGGALALSLAYCLWTGSTARVYR
ncbi:MULTISPECIES: hypothetical protein [unclassified Streptomyces]|uniref:hypothetical protein n=1 Tax=unclassified Streptomyces TaxID=2593676 RepID=UPI00278C5D76|nr:MULTISPECIES: hypothetical protein [unclassified Streptomyces]